jgi:hypothetical protein
VTHASFARGELSYAKVRALTRVATPENEQELLELARACTASQLERSVRAYRRVSTAEAREQLADAQLSVFWNPDGSLEIHGRLAPEDGALFLRAIEAVRDSLWRGSAEPRPARQASNAEALVAVADAALAHGAEGRSGGERYQVVVHTDEAVLARDGEGACELEDGNAVSPETARRLACDASVVHQGRKSRTIPPALRRALQRRDRGCRFPGCENRRFVDAHHVDHWARGGETTLGNLLLLCRRHHRAVHEGGFYVDLDGGFFYPCSIRGAVRSRRRRGCRAGSWRNSQGWLPTMAPASTAAENGWISPPPSTTCLGSSAAGRVSSPTGNRRIRVLTRHEGVSREEFGWFFDPNLSWDRAHSLVESCDRLLGLKEVDDAEAVLGLSGQMN